MSDSSMTTEMLMLSGVSLILIIWILMLSAQLKAAQYHIELLAIALTEHLEDVALLEVPNWQRREAALSALKQWIETRR